MKADYRKVLLQMHGYLLREEQDHADPSARANMGPMETAQAFSAQLTSKKAREKLEQLIQQALTEAFLEESTRLNNPTILKDLLEK